MKQYPASQIRNVAVLGHSGSGKTSFAEAVLFNAKVTDRLGRTNDGNTVLDFDPEETRRHISITTAMAALDWKGTKLNLLDTPGDFDFMGEVMQALRVVDSSLIMISARSGVSVGAEKSIRYSRKQEIPFAFFINKMDDANANFDKALRELEEYAGSGVVPFMLPIYEDGKFTAYVDLTEQKCYRAGTNGQAEEIEIPPEYQDKVEEACQALREVVAETSEDLMEKYFADEEFSEEEMSSGIKQAIKDGNLHPVLIGSCLENIAVSVALDRLIELMPSPLEAAAEKAVDARGDEISLSCDPNGPFAAIVFKTNSDPFVGRITFFKVVSGTVKQGDTLYNPQQERDERISSLQTMLGKKPLPLEQLSAGDIGATTKLLLTATGDTLCRKDRELKLQGIEFPVPSFSMAILPLTNGDEEKIMSGLQKLRDEDPTFNVYNDPETKQMVLAGQGAMQLEVLRAKLLSRQKVESRLEEPRVPYRETIRKKVRVQGKHKKQSGGHGQYGDVWIEFEPGEEDGLTFEVKTVGGSVPKAYNPAVEKGLMEAIERGILAGYPMVNLKATLVDGSYHDVDSSEMAFKLAAGLAFRNGIPQANPILLEPISSVKIYVPEAQLGDIMSDVNQKRGRIMGIEAKSGGIQMVEAEIPTSEMSTYATDLRSITQGRGWYQVEFARYEPAPAPVADKVIADAKAREEA